MISDTSYGVLRFSIHVMICFVDLQFDVLPSLLSTETLTVIDFYSLLYHSECAYIHRRVLRLAFVSAIPCRDRTRVSLSRIFHLLPSRMAAIGTRVHPVLRSVANQSDNGVFNNIFARRFPGLGFLHVVSSSFFSLEPLQDQLIHSRS